jgi:hypothetical protein
VDFETFSDYISRFNNEDTSAFDMYRKRPTNTVLTLLI